MFLINFENYDNIQLDKYLLCYKSLGNHENTKIRQNVKSNMIASNKHGYLLDLSPVNILHL